MIGAIGAVAGAEDGYIYAVRDVVDEGGRACSDASVVVDIVASITNIARYGITTFLALLKTGNTGPAIRKSPNRAFLEASTRIQQNIVGKGAVEAEGAGIIIAYSAAGY